jgi:hypothetical protein
MPKNRVTRKRPSDAPDMLPEYRLDYSKARPNRFAERIRPGCTRERDQILPDWDAATLAQKIRERKHQA